MFLNFLTTPKIAEYVVMIFVAAVVDAASVVVFALEATIIVVFLLDDTV